MAFFIFTGLRGFRWFKGLGHLGYLGGPVILTGLLEAPKAHRAYFPCRCQAKYKILGKLIIYLKIAMDIDFISCTTMNYVICR